MQEERRNRNMEGELDMRVEKKHGERVKRGRGRRGSGEKSGDG